MKGVNMRYGIELILDMNNCNVTKFNRKNIKAYFLELCGLIGVKAEDLHFWDDFRVPVAERQTNPKTKGTTAVQFILTSNITIHTLDLLGTVYVNIFSCEDYDTILAKEFTERYFGAGECKSLVLERGVL